MPGKLDNFKRKPMLFSPTGNNESHLSDKGRKLSSHHQVLFSMTSLLKFRVSHF